MKKQTIFEIIAIIFIALFCICITPITLQNDTFYTIAIGEHIIQNGGIDMMDPFSWHSNLEYTYPHWLYDVITYVVYSIGNMAGIYICTCILAVILGIVIYKVNNKLANNKVVSFFISIGTIYLLRDYITARAQLVTFILFILEVFCIEKFLDTRYKRYGIGLILISILIANLHVAVWPFMFILFLPYIAEYITAIFEERSAKKYGKEFNNYYKINILKKENIKYLVIIMVICMLGGLVSPLGPETSYTYLIKTMQGNTTKNIMEHLPMTLAANIDIVCLLMIFLIVLIFTDVKIRLSDLCMIGGLLLLMLYSKRQASMFILIGSIILNRLLYELMLKNIENVDEKLIKIFTEKMGVILLSVFIGTLCLNFIINKKDSEYIDKTTYPVEISDFILQYFEENQIDLESVRLYNEYNYGSYLLYKNIPVFIDSRADLYAPEFNEGQDIFTDFIESSGLDIWFEETFEKYDITHVILYKDSKMHMVIKDGKLDGYKLLKEDDNFVFYEIEK